MIAYFTPLVLALTTIGLQGLASTESVPDSVTKKQKHISLRLTTRAHSGGFFYFGGKVAEYSPAFDFAVNLETPHFGYTFFKATDLGNIHSSFNFALAGINKTIPLTKRLKVSPQVIVLIEQPHRVVDEGSDVGFTFTTSYKISDHLSIEEMIIVFNLVFETTHTDVINRLRLLYSKKHVDVTLMGWHNNGLVDREGHTTGALSIGYNRVKISEKLLFGASVMSCSTFGSSNVGDVPNRQGIFLSISATII